MNASEFPSTNYSLINQLRHKDDLQSRPALELFMSGYRRALFSFLTRQKNVNEHDAEDLVQEFVVKKILSGKVIELANGKGRFRNLLRKSLQNFLLDEIRRDKRKPIFYLDLSELEPGHPAQFDEFDKAWAVGVFTAVLKQMELSCEHWGVFVDRVLTHPPVAYEAIIERYGYSDPSQSSNALMTAKRTFNRLMVECIEEGSESTDDVKADITYLKDVLNDPTLINDVLAGLSEFEDSAYTLRPLDRISSRDVAMGVIEDVALEQWTDSDLSVLLAQVTSQTVSDFVKPYQGSAFVQDLIYSETVATTGELREIQQLKKIFRRIQSGIGDFAKWPNEIGVTAVFLCDASYIARGGSVTDITSVSSADLVERLGILSKKGWVSGSAKQLFYRAIDALRCH